MKYFTLIPLLTAISYVIFPISPDPYIAMQETTFFRFNMILKNFKQSVRVGEDTLAADLMLETS